MKLKIWRFGALIFVLRDVRMRMTAFIAQAVRYKVTTRPWLKITIHHNTPWPYNVFITNIAIKSFDVMSLWGCSSLDWCLCCLAKVISGLQLSVAYEMKPIFASPIDLCPVCYLHALWAFKCSLVSCLTWQSRTRFLVCAHSGLRPCPLLETPLLRHGPSQA